MPTSLPLTLSENALTVLEKRYLLRDAAGNIAETPEGLFWRVANALAEGDRVYGKQDADIAATAEAFYALMADRAFLPNSPTLMNAGKPGGQLSACFVLPVEDSLDGIFDTLKHAALIHQSGGGTGFSFSRLRPAGDVLRFTSGVTSGPLSFMDVYNTATEAIKQGGTRRGANMGILRVDHPDIADFITAKNDLTRLTNFNISVGITDRFMQAVADGLPFALIHPKTGEVIATVDARALMGRIVESAWRTGEPGLVFLDRVNAENVTPGLGEMEATNPCGEVPLLPYEACNLGSINLNRFIIEDASGQPALDWDRLRDVIRTAVHFLDNVITQNHFPLPQVREMVDGNRKIGLGLMGWADLLIALDLPYDSDAAITLANRVMAFVDYESKWRSVELARERGRFPYFDQSVYTEGTWFQTKFGHDDPETGIAPAQWAALDAAILKDGLRHATTICLAPTGTISILAGASGGIEPLYALAFSRNVMDNTRMTEVHPAFAAILPQLTGNADAIVKHVADHGGVRGLTGIPEAIQHVYGTAHDIAPEWHVRMQAAFQRHCDNAVSKTINFPATASRDDIAKTYRLAFELGLKGITVYRNNSRDQQPMALQGNPNASGSQTNQSCPECQKPLIRQEGCYQCPDCQYAYCG